MPMVVDLRAVPVGTASTSLSSYVAEVIKVLNELGVKYNLHAAGTNIEVDSFEDLSRILRRVAEVLSSVGVRRLLIDVSIDVRLDKELSIEGKIGSVREKLGQKP